MLELAILGLLKEQPQHGYELKKRLADHLGFLSGVSFGSLYPALRRLEKAGAIEALSGADLDAVPVSTTGSLKGDLARARGRRLARPTRRRRKAYRITESGQALFTELLAAESAPGSDDERTFALKLSFCRYLPGPARVELLERRRSALARRAEQLEQALAGIGEEEGDNPADLYTRSLLEHRRDTAAHDLEWVDGLIAAEQRSPEQPRQSPELQGGTPS